MTWVLGSATFFGFAVALSDVCVIFPDGTTRDCLQKIYPVGPCLCAGFAGSVTIGFALIQRLKDLLSVARHAEAWDPVEVAKWWQGDAKEVFNSFPESVRRHHSQMLMVGAHPVEDAGPGWPRTEIFAFSSPDFAPVRAMPMEVISIGSGSQVEEYGDMLKGIFRKNDAMVQLFTMGSEVVAGVLGDLVSERLQRVPTSGISAHLHVCIVKRDSFLITTNDHQVFPRNGPAEDFIMPRVASSLEEFTRMLQEMNSAVEGTIG